MSKSNFYNSIEYTLKIGDWQQVISLCSTNMVQNPEEPNIPVYLGIAHSRIGNLSEAANFFKRASELLPRDVNFQITITKLLLEIGKNKEANNIIETAIKIHGNCPELLVQKGWIKLKSYN
ncbi:tetratricopeptide repeat protein [Dapis sp. BLCC M126]|uniref:tetratricopeptide repeat protein n=1 Tax=Dapis sp. BLCC M126 TaxID=3400189 RepID=UPI003CFA14C8